MKRLTTILSVPLYAVLGFALPKSAFAFGLVLPGCIETGRCHLCQLLELFVSVSNFLLGILGSVALIFFIYGGILLLVSGGSKNMITNGRKVLVGSIVGVVIVFAAYLIVNFVMWSLISDSTVDSPQVFSNAWFDGPGCEFSSQPTSCDGKAAYEPCGYNLICAPKDDDEATLECIEECEMLIRNRPEYSEWSCKPISDCDKWGEDVYGLGTDDAPFDTWAECETGVDCIPNLCPGTADDPAGGVCCL